MSNVKTTIKVEFESDDTDKESLKQALYDLLQDLMDEDLLFEDHTTVKVVNEDDEDEDDEL